jgi:aspartyl/asparaginyl beta-hydroxylase (cupin superfamily)
VADGAGALGERMAAWSVGVGERILAPIDRYVGRRSLCGDAPFFEPAQFSWTVELERGWKVMRAELERLLARRELLPSFQEISSDQRSLSDDDRWKTFFIYGYGHRTELGARLCPHTTALVEGVPGMVTAMFSILSPGKQIPPHRGPYKGLLRYHLGLIVPEQSARCWIRVGGETRSWQEGASLLFDDTYEHEVGNETDQLRAVLFLDVIRPLPTLEDRLNRAVIKAIALSPFVAEARRNQRSWEERFLAAGGLDVREPGALK